MSCDDALLFCDFDPYAIHKIRGTFFCSRDELNKPASSLYVHNLSCTLEAAVRATNAQFEPPHVLSRLHVNLYPNCEYLNL